MRYAYGDSFLLDWRISNCIPVLGKLSDVHVFWAALVWHWLNWVFGHVNDGFLIHSSTAATVPNIYAASVWSWCIHFLCWTGRPPPAIWRCDWHSHLANPEFLHAGIQSLKSLDRNCAAMLIVGMGAFNSWTVFSLRDQQPSAIRLPVLSTADNIRLSVT